MKVVLISPPLVGLRSDPFGSIPGIPLGVAYLAAYLRSRKVDVSIIDAFGESPLRKSLYGGDFVMFGLRPGEIAERVPEDADVVGVSVPSGACHGVCTDIIKRLKRDRRAAVVAGGNQATFLCDDFLEAGADYVIKGEGEASFHGLVLHLQKKAALPDGVAHGRLRNPGMKLIEDLDSLPFPAFDLLPLENYWAIGYAHAPTGNRYLPITSSRGCPFSCRYCSSSRFWQRRWRGRSARNVVDEIEHFSEKYGVKNFHFEDDNFALDRERVVGICREIVDRGLSISWSLPNGVMTDSLDGETLEWMCRAGCTYMSMAPESGSPDVLQKMNKSVDLRHMEEMVTKAKSLGIRVGAFFILGFPGETRKDVRLTGRLARRLAARGLDDLSVFIMTPLPGNDAFSDSGRDFKSCEYLCFSPRWRQDYGELSRHRKAMYAGFVLTRTLHHPVASLRSVANTVFGRSKTKTEMTINRLLKERLL
jgi:anaerobic magnesium-protoporphyrin IX monomethyl ester cyclase